MIETKQEEVRALLPFWPLDSEQQSLIHDSVTKLTEKEAEEAVSDLILAMALVQQSAVLITREKRNKNGISRLLFELRPHTVMVLFSVGIGAYILAIIAIAAGVIGPDYLLVFTILTNFLTVVVGSTVGYYFGLQAGTEGSDELMGIPDRKDGNEQ